MPLADAPFLRPFATIASNRHAPLMDSCSGGSMDSENPRRDEHISHALGYQEPLSAGASSASYASTSTRSTPRLSEAAFPYESAQLAASAIETADAFHTRTVMYPSVVDSPTSEPLFAAPNAQPVIVPVLSAQHRTQPMLHSSEARELVDLDLDELDSDELDSDELDSDAPDLDELDSDAPDLDAPDLDASDVDEPDVDEPDVDEPDVASDYAFNVDPELNLPERLSGQAFTRDDAFAPKERSRDGWKQFRKTLLVLLSVALMLSVAVVGGTVAASYLRRATDHLTIQGSVPTVSSYSNGVVIQPGSESIAPTPEAPKYQIGAWLSNNAPGGGSVKVFVRLTEDVAPIPQIPVTLSVQMPGGSIVKLGPTNTDGYGLAIFTVSFGGSRGAPIFVTASATVGAENLTAETVFVPV
jgi:hypothetical protein